MGLWVWMTTGCEYKVAEPMWKKPYVSPPEPKITSVEPPNEAGPGVNYITIYGTHFPSSKDSVKVYFNSVKAEIVSADTNFITVRRPNLVSDSCVIKVAPDRALVVAKFGPYRIPSVFEPYGGFVENKALTSLTIDKSGNFYVIEKDSRNIYQITPLGEKTTLGITPGAPPFRIRVAPDGNLILLGNANTADPSYGTIYKFDVLTKEGTTWLRLSGGKKVSCGDFDANGILYAGGKKSDLLVIKPDFTVQPTGLYAQDEILDIKVVERETPCIYLLVKGTQAPILAIWKHALGSDGTIGPKELVLDFAVTGEYATYTPKSIAISGAEKKIVLIGTDAPSPILMYDEERQQVDILYKGIIPSYCQQLAWGSGPEVYMILAGTEWNLLKINVGLHGPQPLW